MGLRAGGVAPVKVEMLMAVGCEGAGVLKRTGKVEMQRTNGPWVA